MVKFGVVIFPGSNCDHDMLYVLNHIMGQEAVPLWHKSKDLQNSDVIIVPGGFSFGDYLRAGALCKYSPIMEEVSNFSKDGGYVLGVCNGFQILCEAGLLPGALLPNMNMKFSCKNVYLSVQNSTSPITQNIPKGKIICNPIAHGEGRYYADDATLKKLVEEDRILFKYCTPSGDITEDANPNGSLNNIAGICNETGNVFGMMPHPERAADDHLSNTDGKFILNSLIKTVLDKKTEEVIV